MADAIFELPRLAAIYDVHDAPRDDLEPYLDLAVELGARRVADVGCGTGNLALALAAHGFAVTGVDPAAASLQVAASKPGAERVRWVHGYARDLKASAYDLALMTGNVAQAIADPGAWAATLDGTHRALRPGGRLVFETRDPLARGWEAWTRDTSHRVVDVPGVGPVESWVELTVVELPLVSLRWTFVFDDGDVLTSDSTLRFRGHGEVESDLTDHGFDVVEVRGAPDRPGLELVFIARST